MSSEPFRINEIFQSIQGEGFFAGTPCTFIRFAGCNLSCPYCDTTHEKANLTLTTRELIELLRLNRYRPPLLVLTGGEPTLQITAELIQALRNEYYTIAIETNGTKPVLEGIHHIAVSPKVSNSTLRRNFPHGVDELRYPINVTDDLPDPTIEADHYYLSPIYQGNKLDKRNLEHAFLLCLANPRWKLSVQVHKLLNVR